MISDRKTAIQVRESMLTVNTLLNRCAQIVEDSGCPDVEKLNLKKQIGEMLFISLFHIFKPICDTHPELTPPDFRSDDQKPGVA